jgi:hypothetical protein
VQWDGRAWTVSNKVRRLKKKEIKKNHLDRSIKIFPSRMPYTPPQILELWKDKQRSALA